MPAAAYVPPLQIPDFGVALVDTKTGNLTTNGYQLLAGLVNFVTASNRIIPCNATGTNIITLTMLTTSPLVKQYADFDTYRAVAANTTTGLVTALVATPQGNLATIKAFKTNG